MMRRAVAIDCMTSAPTDGKSRAATAEIDFDALSRMAGVSNAIEVPVHWRGESAP